MHTTNDQLHLQWTVDCITVDCIYAVQTNLEEVLRIILGKLLLRQYMICY